MDAEGRMAHVFRSYLGGTVKAYGGRTEIQYAQAGTIVPEQGVLIVRAAARDGAAMPGSSPPRELCSAGGKGTADWISTWRRRGESS